MNTDRVFIKDIDAIKAFIQLERQKEEYFNHVMDKIMAKKAKTMRA
jgi:hypothetical protein